MTRAIGITIVPYAINRLVFLLALLWGALPMECYALTAAEVFEQVKDSVFVVKSLDSQGEQKSLGSAVLLPSGKFATNCHVVKNGVRFQVGRRGQFVPATLYAGDGDKDICLLDAVICFIVLFLSIRLVLHL